MRGRGAAAALGAVLAVAAVTALMLLLLEPPRGTPPPAPPAPASTSPPAAPPPLATTARPRPAGASAAERLRRLLAEHAPGAERDAALAALLEGLAAEAFAPVADAALDGATPEERQAILAAWGRQDAAAMLAWLHTHPDSLPPSAIEALLAALAEAAPRPLLDALAPLAETAPARRPWLRGALLAWAAADQDAALAWAEARENEALRHFALAALYEQWLAREPDTELILRRLSRGPDDRVHRVLIEDVVLDMAAARPESLALWVETLPPGSRAAVAERALRFWLDRDAAAARRWVDGLPPGPVREAAEGVLLEHWARNGRWREALARLEGREEAPALRARIYAQALAAPGADRAALREAVARDPHLDAARKAAILQAPGR